MNETPLRLYLGARTGGALFVADEGLDDGGAGYRVLARTNRLAPAGAGGEIVVTGLYLVVKHTGAVTLRVTPLVDGYAATPVVVTLQESPVEVVEDRELGVSLPHVHGGVEQFRVAPRGAWVQVQVETAEQVTAPFTIEAVEVEYRVVRESRRVSA